MFKQSILFLTSTALTMAAVIGSYFGSLVAQPQPTEAPSMSMENDVFRLLASEAHSANSQNYGVLKGPNGVYAASLPTSVTWGGTITVLSLDTTDPRYSSVSLNRLANVIAAQSVLS